MSYTPLAVTERISNLKSEYKALPIPMEENPYIDKKFRNFGTGDRWLSLGYLRGWKKNVSALTTRLRASYAEAEELYEAKPIILENDLLLGHLYFPEYTEEEKAEYETLADAFYMSSYAPIERAPRKDHVALDYEKLIKCGIRGVIEEINTEMKGVNLAASDVYPDYGEVKRYEFYKCLLIELEAVIDLARRYSEEAYRLSLTASEPRKSELKKLSEIMKRVPYEPASSFYEAVQSIHFFLSTLFGLYPIGRPDKYLFELYKKDIESGELTRELAQELIDNFCLGISDRVFSRAACGFIVGGSDASGATVENDLTYMFITALDHLRLPDPNGALAVADGTSDELIEYCAKLLFDGVTHPAFYNDGLIINSLVGNYGVSHEDAHDYIHATCAEISIAGKSKSHSTPFIVSLPHLLIEVVKNEQNFKDFDTLYDAFVEKIHEFLVTMSESYLIRMLEGARIGNDSTRSCAFISDCIKKGRSVFEGGERYTFFQPIFIGFANAVDSLIAINRLVFKEERLTLSDFLCAIDANFESHEELRRYILTKLPHYGNDNPEADSLAEHLANNIHEVVKREDVPLSKFIAPGTFSYINHALFGKECGATFDGRLSELAFADGCCPVQGMDVKGPTALIKSLTSWDQSDFLGGMVVNLKFAKNDLGGENRRLLVSLLRAFIKRGGIEMQVNVVDRETLIKAQENPDEYKNLLVRIGGFSDYFVRLSPTLQREIIDRTEL